MRPARQQIAEDSQRQRIRDMLHRLFADPRHGQTIRDDLRAGFSALPIWMQEFLRDLLGTTRPNQTP